MVFYQEYQERKIFGSRLKIVISAGASLRPEVATFLFLALGVVASNAYGKLR